MSELSHDLYRNGQSKFGSKAREEAEFAASVGRAMRTRNKGYA